MKHFPDLEPFYLVHRISDWHSHPALYERGNNDRSLISLRLLLLILIAKGYTVTRARLRQQSAVKVAMFICCYCITYASLFVFEQMYFDAGQVRRPVRTPITYSKAANGILGFPLFTLSLLIGRYSTSMNLSPVTASSYCALLVGACSYTQTSLPWSTTLRKADFTTRTFGMLNLKLIIMYICISRYFCSWKLIGVGKVHGLGLISAMFRQCLRSTLKFSVWPHK